MVADDLFSLMVTNTSEEGFTHKLDIPLNNSVCCESRVVQDVIESLIVFVVVKGAVESLSCGNLSRRT